MRHITLFFAVWYFLFFSGCATPLKVERDSSKYADLVEVDPSDVKFMSYCFFVFVDPEELGAYVWFFKKGTVLLTETHLFIVRGGDVIRLPLSDFSGVRMVVWQLQLLAGDKDKILVIEATSNKIFRDTSETTRLYDLIVAAGVEKKQNGSLVLPFFPAI